MVKIISLCIKLFFRPRVKCTLIVINLYCTHFIEVYTVYKSIHKALLSSSNLSLIMNLLKLITMKFLIIILRTIF